MGLDPQDLREALQAIHVPAGCMLINGNKKDLSETLQCLNRGFPVVCLSNSGGASDYLTAMHDQHGVQKSKSGSAFGQKPTTSSCFARPTATAGDKDSDTHRADVKTATVRQEDEFVLVERQDMRGTIHKHAANSRNFVVVVELSAAVVKTLSKTSDVHSMSSAMVTKLQQKLEATSFDYMDFVKEFKNKLKHIDALSIKYIHVVKTEKTEMAKKADESQGNTEHVSQYLLERAQKCGALLAGSSNLKPTHPDLRD